MKIEDVVITAHAIKRFQQRYQSLKGVQLSKEESVSRINDLLAQAVPEEEGPALGRRREVHKGIGEYFMADHWRFVFSEGGRLETCEIAPREINSVENPYIPAGEEKARFLIKVSPKRQRLIPVTEVTRFSDKKTLRLQNLIEIDAITHALRALGFEVNQLLEPNRLEIVVPRNVGFYQIEQIGVPEKVLIILGQSRFFPLGLQRVHCPGIRKIDLEKISGFLQEVNQSQIMELSHSL